MVHIRKKARKDRFFEPDVGGVFFIFSHKSTGANLDLSVSKLKKRTSFSPFVLQKFERSTFRNAKKSVKNRQ